MTHFPVRDNDPRPMCGAEFAMGDRYTTFVDDVDCEPCNLLEGFRSPDPAIRQAQDVAARELRARLTERDWPYAGE